MERRRGQPTPRPPIEWSPSLASPSIPYVLSSLLGARVQFTSRLLPRPTTPYPISLNGFQTQATAEYWKPRRDPSRGESVLVIGGQDTASVGIAVSPHLSALIGPLRASIGNYAREIPPSLIQRDCVHFTLDCRLEVHLLKHGDDEEPDQGNREWNNIAQYAACYV